MAFVVNSRNSREDNLPLPSLFFSLPSTVPPRAHDVLAGVSALSVLLFLISFHLFRVTSIGIVISECLGRIYARFQALVGVQGHRHSIGVE